MNDIKKQIESNPRLKKAISKYRGCPLTFLQLDDMAQYIVAHAKVHDPNTFAASTEYLQKTNLPLQQVQEWFAKQEITSDGVFIVDVWFPPYEQAFKAVAADKGITVPEFDLSILEKDKEPVAEELAKKKD